MESRERTLELVAGIDNATLETVHSSLLSPLVWDLAHIAAFEDLWISRTVGSAPLRPELMATYDADETPRALRGTLELLDTQGARDYLSAVHDRTLSLLDRHDVADDDRLELVIRHEQQHNETMLQLFQLAHLPNPFDPGDPPGPRSARGQSGLDLVAIPGGTVSIGAGPQGFAYDNERARHAVELAPFQIGRAPVTNGDWLEFVDGGGYDSERWWSVEGWAWRNQEGVSAPMSWVVAATASTADSRQWRLGELLAIDLDAPVVHVSWFEAQAFANAHGARLPTEFEWEMAATWDPDSGGQRGYPWGDAPLEPERANLDQCAGGPAPIGAFPAGASGAGLMAMIGDVWEWTSSRFEGYPGFVAHPYREYSEQFFGGPSRVLRGGSWATRPRVVSTTFRNWDLPQRRQIFAGLRLAKDS